MRHAQRGVAIALICLLLAMTQAYAAEPTAWLNEFNPRRDSRITPAKIHALLTKTGSDLIHTQMVDGKTRVMSRGRALGLGVRNYYRVVGKPAFTMSVLNSERRAEKLNPAAMIYYAAKEFDINVIYLISILQKESSAIGRSGLTQRQLNFVAGFHPSRKPGQKNCGFFGQVMSSAQRIATHSREYNLTMRAAFRIYTPPSKSASAFSSFMTYIYTPYADILRTLR